MSPLVALVRPVGEEFGREQPFREVVVAAVALPPREAQDAGRSERLEDRARAVRRAPPPVDLLAGAEIEGAQRPLGPDAAEDLVDEFGVAREDPGLVGRVMPIPGLAEPGQFVGGQEAEALVVGLEQRPLVVEQRLRKRAPVVGDACRQHQVVVAAGHLERVELDGAQPLEDREHALRRRRQRARRVEQVAADEEAPGGIAGDADRRGRHPAMVRTSPATRCQEFGYVGAREQFGGD